MLMMMTHRSKICRGAVLLAVIGLLIKGPLAMAPQAAAAGVPADLLAALAVICSPAGPKGKSPPQGGDGCAHCTLCRKKPVTENGVSGDGPEA